MEVKAMEIKKSQQLTKPTNRTTNDATEKATSWVNAFGDVKSEFSKITWTSPEELKLYTKIVVGAALFLGLGIYFVDVMIRFSLSALEAAMRWIAS